MISLIEHGDNNLTPEEKALRSARARRRFKAIFRRVVDNLPWLTRKIDRLHVKKDDPLQILKDKTIGLNLRQKFLLLKSAEQRDHNEKNQLRRLIGNLKCFQKYPLNVKREFPSFMYFCYYGPDRLLVKQGNEAERMYVLITGEIIIQQTNWDPILKENITKTIGTFGSGYSFGDDDLLHKTQRCCTVTTQTDCEFIYLNKDDFDQILNDKVKTFWDEVQLKMSWFNYFDNWSKNDILDVCISSQKKEYAADQVVLSDEIGNRDNIYFITKGFCCMLEKISFKNRNNNIRTCLIKICRFNKLACFNLGEDLEKRLIIAGTETECLLLPRYFLHFKALSTFKSVQQFLEITIPTHEKVLRRYQEIVKFRKLKKNLETRIKRKSVINFIYNIPYSIRLMNDVDFVQEEIGEKPTKK